MISLEISLDNNIGPYHLWVAFERNSSFFAINKIRQEGKINLCHIFFKSLRHVSRKIFIAICYMMLIKFHVPQRKNGQCRNVQKSNWFDTVHDSTQKFMILHILWVIWTQRSESQTIMCFISETVNFKRRMNSEGLFIL